jgi:hypothetical protein
MGAYIAKQPNGLYCRFSSIVDCPTDYDLDEDDVLSLYIGRAVSNAIKDAKRAIKDANTFDHWKDIRDDFQPMNMTVKKFKKFLKDCGDKEPFTKEFNEDE